MYPDLFAPAGDLPNNGRPEAHVVIRYPASTLPHQEPTAWHGTTVYSANGIANTGFVCAGAEEKLFFGKLDISYIDDKDKSHGYIPWTHICGGAILGIIVQIGLPLVGENQQSF